MANLLLASVFLVSMLVGLALAAAVADSIAYGKQLVDSNASCASLNASQLGDIGDYLMEQMHPGAAHDAMDRMLGGEGSDSLTQAHIQMARVLYCGETNATVTYGAMLGMMPALYGYNYGGFGGGMMGSGMMGYGYMGGYGGLWWVVGLVFWLLVLFALLLLIIWLYRQVFKGGGSVPASELLRQRYAKGELTKKQFEEMKKDLES